jgi:hypothetical protein
LWVEAAACNVTFLLGCFGEWCVFADALGTTPTVPEAEIPDPPGAVGVELVPDGWEPTPEPAGGARLGKFGT